MADPAPGPAPGAPALTRPGAPWPANAAFGPTGLEIAGLPATELAERYGTPLLVFDEEDVRARMRAARALFPRVSYAIKAFTSHAAIRIAVEEGLDLLASTGGEAEACLRAGVPAGRIALHGSNKSDDELALAVRAGLGLVVVDALDELLRLDAIADGAGSAQAILLRVNPEVEVATHEAIATGHEASKFGVSLADAQEAVRLATSLLGVRLVGLHAHVGSQVLDLEPYLRALDALAGLLAEARERHGFEAALVDVGGGFGITYTDERALSLDAVAAGLTERLRRRCGENHLAVPELAVEPGRCLVGNAALTLYRIGARKEAGGRTLLAVDGGMSDNVRPMLYDARYTVAMASPPGDDAPGRTTVVGKHCESGDVLAEDVELPADAGRGDLLAFAATGAYTYPLASTYNRVGRPAVVAVRDGGASVWLRREDPADMDRLEAARPRPLVRATSPEGIVIRPARPRDARSFAELIASVADERRYLRSEEVLPLRVYRSRFRRSWTSREAQIVAVEDGRVVGHLFIQRETHPVTEHVASIGIAVAHDRRGGGVGSALMSHAIRWARSVGVEKIVLAVYPHNTAAIALYRKFGFVDEGRLARHSRTSSGDDDEILMATWIERETS
jgi:diaminopimelate decarboxylase